MRKLKKEELIAFVEELTSQGSAIIKAIKTSPISAYEATSSEKITTTLKNGKKETENTSQNGDWVITNPNGEQYLISNAAFKQKYHFSDNEYLPNNKPQFFIKINCDIMIEAPWGEEQFIAAGGVLNITNQGDIYGVASDEFLATYKEIKSIEKK